MTGGDEPIGDPLVDALRTAGCVYAEDEAAVLRETAADDAAELDRMLRRRVAGEPLEAVVGWVDFCGLRLSVGPGVFVPRRRSRMLMELALGETLRAHRRGVFVEAFAGVAPIALAVQAIHPRVEIHVTDIDPTALAHARANLRSSAGVHVGSVLDGLPADLEGWVDIIAAVPPYVPDGEAAFLPREARDFEPAAALFGGQDGLDLVWALITEAHDWLRPDGRLLIEMNRRQCEAAAAHGERLGFGTRVVHGDDGQTAVLVLRKDGGTHPSTVGSHIPVESPI